MFSLTNYTTRYATSVSSNFKLPPRDGLRRETSLGDKTVKALRGEAFTVLPFNIL
jgi:hypothetical protein